MSSHGPCRVSTGGMLIQVEQTYTDYGLTTYFLKFCSQCLVCTKNNPQGNYKVKPGTFPKPRCPFEQIWFYWTNQMWSDSRIWKRPEIRPLSPHYSSVPKEKVGVTLLKSNLCKKATSIDYINRTDDVWLDAISSYKRPNTIWTTWWMPHWHWPSYYRCLQYIYYRYICAWQWWRWRSDSTGDCQSDLVTRFG